MHGLHERLNFLAIPVPGGKGGFRNMLHDEFDKHGCDNTLPRLCNRIPVILQFCHSLVA